MEKYDNLGASTELLDELREDDWDHVADFVEEYSYTVDI